MPDSNCKVLVVEPNELSRFLIEKIAQKQGVNTHIVSNIDEAISSMEHHTFHLALIDLHQERLEEFDFAKSTVDSFKMRGMKCVALVDYTVRRTTFHNWRDLGFDTVVDKPLRHTDLNKILVGSRCNKSAV